MCYATKRKIADCVKQLMRKKEIRKITIQDIMDETHMSRQSFYYHFKDIYDVLEWVTEYDFAKRIAYQENESVEEWILNQFHVLSEERAFFERVVNELEWPKLLNSIISPIEDGIASLMRQQNQVLGMIDTRDIKSYAHLYATAYCYFLMDYIYHKKQISDQELLRDVIGMFSFLKVSPGFHVPFQLLEPKTMVS
ncbi:MAG: TetR family transcriptional regulator [bacterium]|nr:TetR family transcriptional regulator [bacterium]